MNRTAAESVAAVIDAVLAGTMTPSDAVSVLEALPQELWDRTLDDAYHFLIHFRDDEDIRERDSRYAENQRRWLARRAAQLRSGEDNPRA